MRGPKIPVFPKQPVGLIEIKNSFAVHLLFRRSCAVKARVARPICQAVGCHSWLMLYLIDLQGRMHSPQCMGRRFDSIGNPHHLMKTE